MRLFVYLSLLIVLIAGVMFKTRVIKAKQQAEVVSVFLEWKKHGKPVTVETIKKGPIEFTLTISGFLKAAGRIRAHLSPALMRKARQVKACPRSPNIACVYPDSIQHNLLTGLYDMDFFIPHSAGTQPGTLLSANIPYAQRQGILRIPFTALHHEDDHTRCWVVVDGIAKKRTLITGIENGYFAQVRSGIQEGTLVVTAGASHLQEGDVVQPVSEDGGSHD